MPQHSLQTMLATLISIVLLVVILIVVLRATRRRRLHNNPLSLSNRSYLVNGQLTNTQIHLLDVKGNPSREGN